MNKSFNEIEIINGCKKSNSVYQRALVMQYSELLFATAFRYLKDEDETKDVLQDSFIRIFKSIKNFDPQKGKLTSWMCKVVINESLKQWHKRKNKVSYNEHFELAVERPLVVGKLKTDELYQMIRELEDPYKMVFNLHVIEGYPHQEIAEILEIKVGSSRSILSRAKEMLRQKINTIKKTESWV